MFHISSKTPSAAWSLVKYAYTVPRSRNNSRATLRTRPFVLSEGSGIPQASKPQRLTKQFIQRQTGSSDLGGGSSVFIMDMERKIRVRDNKSRRKIKKKNRLVLAALWHENNCNNYRQLAPNIRNDSSHKCTASSIFVYLFISLQADSRSCQHLW